MNERLMPAEEPTIKTFRMANWYKFGSQWPLIALSKFPQRQNIVFFHIFDSKNNAAFRIERAGLFPLLMLSKNCNKVEI